MDGEINPDDIDLTTITPDVAIQAAAQLHWQGMTQPMQAVYLEIRLMLERLPWEYRLEIEYQFILDMIARNAENLKPL